MIRLFKFIGYGLPLLGVANVIGETGPQASVAYSSSGLEQRSPFGDRKPRPKPVIKTGTTAPTVPVKKPELPLSKRDLSFVGFLSINGYREYVIHEKIKTDFVYQIINQQFPTLLHYKAGKYDAQNQTLEVLIDNDRALCKLGESKDNKGGSSTSSAKVAYGNSGS
ncbi:MAG: hypothetical protein K2L24_03155, partial [Opitutales bacterium]|nr:hypothetical protein [Opitutales bacterium]